MDSNCIFYQGPWTEGMSSVLFIVGWQEDIRTQQTFVEAHTIIPTTPAVSHSADPVRLSVGCDLPSWIADLRLSAAGVVQSRFAKTVSARTRFLYPEMNPYQFKEVSESKKPSSELMQWYSSASQDMRGLLLRIENGTQCEALRICLEILRGLFPEHRGSAP